MKRVKEIRRIKVLRHSLSQLNIQPTKKNLLSFFFIQKVSSVRVLTNFSFFPTHVQSNGKINHRIFPTFSPRSFKIPKCRISLQTVISQEKIFRNSQLLSFICTYTRKHPLHGYILGANVQLVCHCPLVPRADQLLSNIFFTY